jgi:hypothetical protein
MIELADALKNKLQRYEEEIISIQGQKPAKDFADFWPISAAHSVKSIMTCGVAGGFDPDSLQVIIDGETVKLVPDYDDTFVIRQFNIRNSYMECFFEQIPNLVLRADDAKLFRQAVVDHSKKPLDELLTFTDAVIKNMW